MFAAGGGKGRTSGAALQARRQRLRRGRDAGTSCDQSAGAASLNLSRRVALPEVAGPAFSSAAEGALRAPRGEEEEGEGLRRLQWSKPRRSTAF